MLHNDMGYVTYVRYMHAGKQYIASVYTFLTNYLDNQRSIVLSRLISKQAVNILKTFYFRKAQMNTQLSQK